MALAVASPPSFWAEVKRVTSPTNRREHPILLSVATIAVVAGIVLRFYAPSPLWLDETISVNISRLPLTQIPRALSHDGAPPLYYVLLHFWMLAFGRGDFAVRALSGIISVIGLPFFWAAGRRLGGRNTAWVAFFLGLSSPFAINYATATRMYSMMILWSVLGFLAIVRVFECPTRRRLIALGAVTAATIYTHYWGLYFVLVAGIWLLYRVVREVRSGTPDPWPVRQAFTAMVIGSLFWLPWSPVFVYQAMHTGTPWSGSAGPGDLIQVFSDFSGTGAWGNLLMFLFFGLVLVGIFGRPTRVPSEEPGRPGPAAITFELRPRREMLPLVWVTLGTLGVAVALGAVADAAFVARYAAVVLPPFILLVAAGIATFRSREAVAGIVGVMVVAGLVTGFSENQQPRTQAVKVAAVLNAEAQPGDVVVYCPDQLGPAVDRLLKVPGVTELTFPRAIGAQRVNWVDYKKVIASTNVGSFAQDMLSRVGADNTLWLVWRNGYAGLGGSCGSLYDWLNLLRPSGVTVVSESTSYYEYENLVRFPT